MKLFSTLPIFALLLYVSFGIQVKANNEDLDENRDILIDFHTTSVVDFTPDSISIYSTGFSAEAKTHGCLSAYFRGSVDGKIDEISSDDLDLGRFVKELNLSCDFKTENMALVLSVGKMPSGFKLDPSNPGQPGGVMGVQLNIEPEKIPLIQKWLDAHELKILKITITRYNSQSADRLDPNDLSETDMTSLALFLSKGRNIQAFFIRKQPDANNTTAPTSTAVGVIYMRPDMDFFPQLFAMVDRSEASYMDLNLLVLSASVKVAPESDYRFGVTYSRAVENVSETDVNTYDFSLSRTIKKGEGKHSWSITGAAGVKVERGSKDDETVYVRIEFKH